MTRRSTLPLFVRHSLALLLAYALVLPLDGWAQQVLHRANAGGTVAASSGPDWSDDAQYLVAGDTETATNGTPNAIDSSVPSGTPSQIWTSERWDPESGNEMQYEFAVASGTQVEVRPYFYDGFTGTSTPGDRVFDVSVEDQTASSFDVIDAYGDQTGGMKSFTVTSDGTIDIDFAHVVENPQINAIEIVDVQPQPNEMGGTGSVDFGTVLIGNSQTETVTLTNLGGTGDPSISITNVNISGALDFSHGPASTTTLAPGGSATIDVTFEPSDGQLKSGTLEVAHSGKNSPLTVALSGDGASSIPVGFSQSGLNVSLGNPTSLDFGPDGRLYVSQQSGEIKAFTVTRNGANSYSVTDTEVISTIQDIPNHNDDGTYNSGVGNRQVTGITAEGTSTTPVLYVTSSDPRIGAGGGHQDIGLDTNSGVISRLTKQPDGSWNHVMLVRGLPRSEENHSTNGIQYDAAENVLYVAQGGHTNKGAPSDNFALTPEYALSAAILTVDLDAIDQMTEKSAANTSVPYLYDLPTLQNTATPFGGDDGANMAMWTANSPVQVYAPGFRNTYDIALTGDGQLYATDNSANNGWGGIVVNEGPQGTCTNDQNEQDEYSIAGVYYVEEGGYYGHPNPTRGNPNSSFGAAVESGLHNPVDCDYIDPASSDPGAAIATFGTTPQGMSYYPASNFGGDMQGNLLLAGWNDGSIVRVVLTPDGTDAADTETLLSGFGSNPLDVTAQGDNDVFPGTIWAATYGSDQITVFEPNDYEGTGGGGSQCTAADDPSLDEDNDGYDNADEIDNGTDPCSGGSQPTDADGDFISDLNDNDDDNDGLLDTEDPFAIDADNGLTTALPVTRPFVAGQFSESLLGLGFTGLMTNGTDYADLYDPTLVKAGGATEKFSVDEVPFGDAYQSKNSQEYAFQFGVDTPSEPFVVHTTVVAPFSDDMTPENYQSAGLQIGAGDQDNYVKLVATAQDASGNPNGGIEFVMEVGGTVGSNASAKLSDSEVFGSGKWTELYLTVDPTTDPAPSNGTAEVAVTAEYEVYDVTQNGQRTLLSGPTAFPSAFAAPADWFTSSSQGLAVGVISTANGANETFSASWDQISVQTVTASTAPVADAGPDQTVDEGTTVTLDGTGSSDPNSTQPLGYSWVQTDGPSASLSVQDDAQPTFTAPDVTGDQALTFELTVTDAESQTDTDEVVVTVTDQDAPAVALYRVNAGATASYTDDSGNDWVADDFFTEGQTSTIGGAIDGTPNDALYQSERYGGGSESGSPPPFTYEFDVDNGTYDVALHLAETWFGLQGTCEDQATSADDSDICIGDRVFSVSAEGQTVLSEYDIYAEAGGSATAIVETIQDIEVTDGTLTLEFFTGPNGANNAKASAIAVFPAGDAVLPTIALNSPQDGATITGDEIVVDWTGTPLESDDHVHVTLDNNPYVGSQPLTGSYTFENVAPGSHTLTVEVADVNHTLYQNPEASASVTVTVEAPAVAGTVLYRVNAGGAEHTDGDGNVWAADDYSSGGQVPNVVNEPIAGTDEDVLYQSERFGGGGNVAPFSYNFPVDNGTHDVALHFAEIFHGVSGNNSAQCTNGDCTGKRVFSVDAEGQTVLSEYDIFAEAGASATAIIETISGIEVTDGELNLSFYLGENGMDNAKVSAITVRTSGATPGEAVLAVDAGEGIGATTYDTGSFELTNTGTESISTVVLDLKTAVLPDVVFDPDGTAGDDGAKGFVLDNNGTSGTVQADVSVPHNGIDGDDGYDKLTINFSAFEPGESITFSMDNDPTTIKGGSGVQSGEAGPISGLELTGSTMTVTFGGGATVETSLFSDGSPGGSQATADATTAPAPTLGVQGVSLSGTTLSPTHTAATVSTADQTITIDGPAGAPYTLLRVEGELNLEGVPTYDGTPGYDVEAYEANTAVAVEEYTGTLGSGGTAAVPVTLTNSTDTGGLNYFIATVADDESETGRTSNTLVLDYTPSGGTPLALIEVNVNTGVTGSTYNNGSFTITNNSTGNVQIESISFDLSSAVLPDVVFDPVGNAGDIGGKCFTANSGASSTGLLTDGSGSGTGSCADPFSQAHDGDGDASTDEGYDVMTLTFDNFDPGESFSFAVDVDPTTIKGDGGSGDAGSISGLELAGSTITVGVNDGAGATTVTTSLFSDGSGGGSLAYVKQSLLPPPTLAVQGSSAPATVGEAAQALTLTGTPNASVTLLQVDARLFIESSTPNGGFDIDPFEANEAMAIQEYAATLDENGTTTIPVTLLQTDPSTSPVSDGPSGGLNHFLAVQVDGDGHTGLASNTVVLELGDPSDAIDVPIADGWNLVGLPLEVADASRDALFPTSEAGTLYGFDGGYTTPNSLVTGQGYWLQFSLSQATSTQTISGTEITSLSTELNEGWNLVAGPSCSVPLSGVSDPSGVIVAGTLYGFSGGYTTPNDLVPGQGYWIQADATGTITFDCSATASPAALASAKLATAPTATGHMALTIADAADRRQTLYVGAAPKARSYALPPTPPAGAFDARFDGDTRLLAEDEGVVRLQSDRYPLTVTLESAGKTATSDRPGVIVDALDGSRVVATHELERTTAAFTVRDPAITALRVRTRASLPASFALHGNYPNPFVDQTSVAFDLPEEANVQLEVYDLLGRRVVSVPPRRLSAGAQRTLALDASRLTTGAYFYRLRVEMASGSVTKTGRMTLVK